MAKKLLTKIDPGSKKTFFWSVELETELILDYQPIKKYLEIHKELVPLKKIHTTMLSINKLITSKENIRSHGSKKCIATLENRQQPIRTGLAARVTPEDRLVPIYTGLAARVTVSGHGTSSDALTLKVDSIKFMNTGPNLPSITSPHRITVALAANIKMIGSIKIINSNMDDINYDTPLILEGLLVRNIYLAKN